MVDLGGYVIILTQQKNGKIKLYGSPADRPDCDEVLEINGRNLEDASHQHIIHYIHQVSHFRFYFMHFSVIILWKNQSVLPCNSTSRENVVILTLRVDCRYKWVDFGRNNSESDSHTKCLPSSVSWFSSSSCDTCFLLYTHSLYFQSYQIRTFTYNLLRSHSKFKQIM